MTHYIAPGKTNIVWHLTRQHKDLLHTEKELKKWTMEELNKTHREMHDAETQRDFGATDASSVGNQEVPPV